MNIENQELEEELKLKVKQIRPAERGRSIPPKQPANVLGSLIQNLSPMRSPDEANQLEKQLAQKQKELTILKKESKTSNNNLRTLLNEKQEELSAASQEIDRLTHEMCDLKEEIYEMQNN